MYYIYTQYSVYYIYIYIYRIYQKRRFCISLDTGLTTLMELMSQFMRATCFVCFACSHAGLRWPRLRQRPRPRDAARERRGDGQLPEAGGRQGESLV